MNVSGREREREAVSGGMLHQVIDTDALLNT